MKPVNSWKLRGSNVSRASALLSLILLPIILNGCSLIRGRHYDVVERYRGELLWPLYGEVSSEYGRRGWFKHHKGIDIRAPHGTEVRAAHDGKIIFSGVMNGFGKIIKLEGDDGIATWYAHHSKNLVGKGERVKQGDLIALVGSTGNATGPHLHFEIHVENGDSHETLDPLRFFPGERR